jgi:NADH-quinone oxidoreductase subunit C
MESNGLLAELTRRFGAALTDVSEEPGTIRATVARESLLGVCRFCRTHEEAQCDYLACLCGVDAGEAIQVVYHLYSLPREHMVILRAAAPKEDCWLDSVTAIWKAANWHERETAEMLGVTFRDHPNPRHLLLPDGWKGHPLRKDYVPEPDYTRPDELPEGAWEEFRRRVDSEY